MTQVAYRSSADFYKAADEALIAYLTTDNGHARLSSLYTFLAAEGVTFRARSEERPLMAEAFPLGYVRSELVRSQDLGQTVTPQIRTRVRVWSHYQDVNKSMRQALAIGGAVASMIKQTIFDGSSSDWAYYSNDYPESSINNVTTQPPVVEVNAEGSPTGRVRWDVTTTWFHRE